MPLLSFDTFCPEDTPGGVTYRGFGWTPRWTARQRVADEGQETAKVTSFSQADAPQ